MKNICLGIELGSTRIKAVAIDEHHIPVSSGDYTWKSSFEHGVWTYDLQEVWKGLKQALSGIGFGIDLGLMYNMQGAKVNLGQKKVWSSLGYGNENVTLHSLTIPFHLRFKWTRLNGLEDIIAPLIYGGPEFNIQVAHGKCKAFKYSGGDLSLTVGGGVELKKKWQITGGYSWGMTYALKTKLLDNYSAQSRQWHIRLAYFF